MFYTASLSYSDSERRANNNNKTNAKESIIQTIRNDFDELHFSYAALCSLFERLIK